MSEKTFPKKGILGVGVSMVPGYNEATDRIADYIRNGEQAFIAAINPEKLVRATNDPGFMEILNSADLAICDGTGIAIAGRILCGTRFSRITGIALFFKALQRAEEESWRVYFLGASATVNEQAVERIRLQHPNLQVAGFHHGYFEDDGNVVQDINRARPDIVFVALGSPKQEFWIDRNRDAIESAVLMGIGGTLDVASGRVTWAPEVFRRTGTEWLYRLVTDPKRWRRQLALPRFVAMVFSRVFRQGAQRNTA